MGIPTSMPGHEPYSIDDYLVYFSDIDQDAVDFAMPVIQHWVYQAYIAGYQEEITKMNARAAKEPFADSGFDPMSYGHRTDIATLVERGKLEVPIGFELINAIDKALVLAYKDAKDFANGYFNEQKSKLN